LRIGGTLIDSRNRLEACEIAGVEPQFKTLEFETDDNIKAFVQSRSARRDLSKGERAMAIAFQYPEATKLRRKGSGHETGQQISKQRISDARAVLRHSAELTAQVRDGT
jgi:hypothetical protein